MANITINPTPKLRFQQQTIFMQKHREFLMTEEFERAMDTAMLQLQTELAAKCTGQYEAMAMGLRLLGAQELVAKLWELAHIPEQRKQSVSDNLNHRV